MTVGAHKTHRPDPDGPGAVVLVEGESDRVALCAVAIRRDLDLERARIEVVALGGAQAIGAWLRNYRDRGDRRRLGGLYDAGEETVFRRGLQRHGFGELSGRRDLEACGFFCCDLDLEDELIRALGAQAVISAIEGQGDAQRFRTLQHQPEWRGREVEAQLRRFMGSGARRKIRYAKSLVEALDADRVPRPLDAVLQAVLVPPA
jgi:Overcoming lysogenization defect protein-like, TOPRIM domain